MSSFAVRVANLLGKPFGINPFPRAHANWATDGSVERQRAFDNIHLNLGWGSAESVSGPGSEIARASAYARQLRDCLERLEADTIFDAPCGDLNWIRSAVEGVRYIGGDIAPSLVKTLMERHPKLDVRLLDICEDRFPKATVWHCRDCLFHLPFADIEKALLNYLKSDIPWALLTTHRSQITHRNLDIPVGGWRYLDLELSPISLPRPAAYLKDYRRGLDFPRHVGLWSKQQIRSALGCG